MYQWLGAISTLTPISVQQQRGVVKFPLEGTKGAAGMKNTFTLAITKSSGQWCFGSEKYNPYKSNNVEVELTETTLDFIKANLKKFAGTTPLLKQMKEDELRLEKLKKYDEMRLKRKDEEGFMNRLKQLCFLCYEKPKVESESERIYEWADVMPEFPGGNEAMKLFLSSNLNLPADCSSKKGTVYVRYVVDLDGSIVDPKVIKSLSPCHDTEALRLVKLMPKWSPATTGGQNVKITYDFPIKFVRR